MEQNFANHARIVKPYHLVLGFLLIVGLIGSIINLVKSVDTNNLYSASLLVLIFIICLLTAWYARVFPLKAQDRAIRAEENLRHYILTGKTLPAGLTLPQIIALRFAPDDEFIDLTKQAVSQNLSVKEIKAAIKSWKADHHRV